MFVDYLTTAAIADHLRRELVGARVQSVVQPNRLTLAMELYAGERSYLTLTADPAREGIALGSRKARRGDDPPSPLFQAVRAHLVGARLTEVIQPPFERLLVLELNGAERWRLVAELTGRMANLVLVNPDGTVRVAARRVTAKMSGARQIGPGLAYQAPPAPAGKVEPHELVAASPLAGSDHAAPSRAERSADSPNPPETETILWQHLVSNVRGVSPLLAKEAVHRATGNWQATAADAPLQTVVPALLDLMRLAQTNAWAPCVVVDKGRVTAYAPYMLTHLAGTAARPSIFAAIEDFEAVGLASGASSRSAVRAAEDPLPDPEAHGPGRADAYAEARRGVARLIEVAEGKRRRRIGALEREAARETDAEGLKEAGDLILAFGWQVKKGARQLEVSLDPELPPTVIQLDPAMSAMANAERYFERYRKARRARAGLPERIAALQQELDALSQLGLDLELATTRPAIDAVHDALLEAGFVSGRRRLPRSAAPAGPGSLVSSDGFTLWFGRNGRQNEVVTFQKASRDDLWLHVAQGPGSHVVIKSAGRTVPERTVLEAASLAARYSKARAEASVAVLVAEARRVRRVAGGSPGLVTVSGARTVVVEPVDAGRTGL